MTSKEWTDSLLEVGYIEDPGEIISDLAAVERERDELDQTWRENHRRQLHRAEAAEVRLARMREKIEKAIEGFGTPGLLTRGDLVASRLKEILDAALSGEVTP